jgi:hypothetical protein
VDLRVERYSVVVNCMKVLDHGGFDGIEMIEFICIPRLYLLFMIFYPGSVINISSHFILFTASKIYSNLPVNLKGIIFMI